MQLTLKSLTIIKDQTCAQLFYLYSNKTNEIKVIVLRFFFSYCTKNEICQHLWYWVDYLPKHI